MTKPTAKKNTKDFIIIAAVFLVCGFVLFVLFSHFSFSGKQIKLTPETKRIHLKPASISVEVYDGKIEPNNFNVKPGQEVVLTIISMEGEHSIRFENKELSQIRADFEEPGETLKITFTAPKEPGEYVFYCSKEGHRKKGEEGKMIVK
jgi:plastocyanin